MKLVPAKISKAAHVLTSHMETAFRESVHIPPGEKDNLPDKNNRSLGNLHQLKAFFVTYLKFLMQFLLNLYFEVLKNQQVHGPVVPTIFSPRFFWGIPRSYSWNGVGFATITELLMKHVFQKGFRNVKAASGSLVFYEINSNMWFLGEGFFFTEKNPPKRLFSCVGEGCNRLEEKITRDATWHHLKWCRKNL